MSAIPHSTFQHLQLRPNLVRAVERRGYKTPTPIQAQAIPAVLARRDVLGCAQTGTGKTAAFALPILQGLMAREKPAGHSIFSLILSPTRELATQIGQSIAAYGAELPFRHTIIYGGVPKGPQIAALTRGVDIIVATPGRLIDIGTEHFINFSHLEVFVLDEADRMLDMGFIDDVEAIAGILPKKRQTVFFSATMPPRIRALAQQVLTDPMTIEVTPESSTVETVEQMVYRVNDENEFSLLLHLLGDQAVTRALIFTETKFGAAGLARGLTNVGVFADAIHGGQPQYLREKVLGRFARGELRILVATDVASRGLDIRGVSHVINTSVPADPEVYVHRIGRTARAGERGVAYTFCNFYEQRKLAAIERAIGKQISVAGYFPN